MGMKMLDHSRLLTWLDQEIARAEQDFARHAGNQSACQLHKDGRVTGGMKYDEGRLVALTTLRRIVSKQDTWAPAQLAEALQSEQNRWQRALQTYQSAEHPSIAWVAYQQGGVDAVAAAGAALAALASSSQLRRNR